MFAIDCINAIILFCESEVDLFTCCVTDRRGGWCVGKLLFVGFKSHFKGIDSYVNKFRGYRCEFAVKRVKVFLEVLDFFF